MSKVLVIPGGVVPYNDTVTLLSYKHLRLLNQDIDVVALKGKEDKGILEDLKKDENYNKFHIEYVCDYDDAIATFERKNVISGVWNLFKYCRAAKKKALKGDYKVVYTSSVPAFTHMAGYWIKKALGDKIVWIASITDPLYKSPYKYDSESFKEYSIIGKIGFYVYIFIYMNGWYEKICQKYADKVVYICDEQREFMISHYPNQKELYDKSMVIPLNYIEDWKLYKDLMKKQEVHNTPKVIAHFGRVYGLRKIDALLEALKELKLADKDLSKKVRFEQYGQLLDRYITRIKEYDLEDVFFYFDKIPYDKALEKMYQSDVLALYDTFVDEGLQPYLPSKALEYLLLHKDLFVMTPDNSPSHRIFNEYGYTTVSNDVEAIKKEILKLIETSGGNHDYDISCFENEEATASLRSYIEACCK